MNFLAGPPPKSAVNPQPKQNTSRLSYGSSRDSRDSTFMEENPLAVADELSPLTSGVENPLTDEDMDFGVTNIDDFDDQLFDTLAEMELHNEVSHLSGRGRPKSKVESASGGRPASKVWSVSEGRPESKVGSASGRGRKVERGLSQQEFDQIWDNICATIPDSNEFS